MDWERWATVSRAAGGAPFREFAEKPPPSSKALRDIEAVTLIRGLPAAERRAAVAQRILRMIGLILRIPFPKLNPAEPLRNMGMDSLIAVELAHAVEMEFHVTLRRLDLQGATPLDVADKILAALSMKE